MGPKKLSFYDFCIENNRLMLLNEWDKEKNEGLMPQDVSHKSGKKIWWKCKEGHEWLAFVYNRTNGTACPFCKGKRVTARGDNLAAVAPEVAAQWHPTKNGTLTPETIGAQSGKKVWWQCSKGHEWQAVVYNRTQGTGCPHCARKRMKHRAQQRAQQRALAGGNNLATLAPEVAAQWHPTKNGKLTPETTGAQSCRKVWWRCEKGHEWQAFVCNRTNGASCPFCSGKWAEPGVNDLATVAPEVAAQWHPMLNEGITPETILAKSRKKVWWQCKEGHEWLAIVRNRTMGSGCPFCSPRSGKELLAKHRELLREAKEKLEKKDGKFFGEDKKDG